LYLVEVRAELVRVPVALGEWLEHYHIEGLKRMGWMRRKDHKESPMAIVVLDKLHHEMRSKAIKDE
jgi:hypothetical protein